MSVDYGKEDGDLFTFIHFGNKFYVVDRIEKEKELESTFRLRPFSSNKNAEAPIILLQKKYSNAAKVPKVHFWTSVDQSTYYSIAVVDQNSPTRSTELEINAFDHSLTNTRTQTFTLPIKEDQFKLITVFEDSKDAVWIIYATPDTTRKTEKRVTYGMFKFLPNNPVQVQVPLDFQGNMLTSFKHSIDKNDHIHFVGVFEKDEPKATKNTSLVYLKLDPDGKPVSYAQKKFTAKEMDILGDENMYVGKDGDIGLSPQVLMKSLFVFEDGSVKLLMEYNSIKQGGVMQTSRTYYALSQEHAEIMRRHEANRPKMKYEDTYESHDIVVVNINPSGMFEKPWRISKRQRFSGIDNNLSYSALLVGSKLYLMFNDNVSNLEEPVDTPDPATMERFRKNTVVLVTATQDGVIKKEEIPALSDGKFLIAPMYTRRTGPASMAFYYERIRSAGTDYRLGHIRFLE